MKPNWKAYAKEAYKRGYERGIGDMSKWNDAADPPKEDGPYLCIVGRMETDKLWWTMRIVDYDSKHGGFIMNPLTNYTCVVKWIPMPSVPRELTDSKVPAVITIRKG